MQEETKNPEKTPVEASMYWKLNAHTAQGSNPGSVVHSGGRTAMSHAFPAIHIIVFRGQLSTLNQIM